MKNEVSPPLLIGAIVALVLILGFIGYKVFVPSNTALSPEQLKAAQAHKKMKDGGD